MTIPEAAKLYGKTPQAIYNRINRAKKEDPNFKLENLLQKGTSSLTVEGEALIAEWFKQSKASKSTERLIQLEKGNIELSKRINEIERSLEQKTEECSTLINKRNQLEQDISLMREQLQAVTEERDFLRLTVSQLNETQRLTLAALQPSAHEQGLLARIKARFAKKGDNKQ